MGRFLLTAVLKLWAALSSSLRDVFILRLLKINILAFFISLKSFQAMKTVSREI